MNCLQIPTLSVSLSLRNNIILYLHCLIFMFKFIIDRILTNAEGRGSSVGCVSAW